MRSNLLDERRLALEVLARGRDCQVSWGKLPTQRLAATDQPPLAGVSTKPFQVDI
jgi:hypothetical protein